MRVTYFDVFASACAVALVPMHVAAQNARDSAGAYAAAGGNRAKVTILPLHNGRNRIDLLGTGEPGEIIVSRRDNGNAHGHSTVLFQVLTSTPSDDASSDRLWRVIPFFGGPNDSAIGEELYRTFEGADCTLGDLRVIRRGTGRPVEVVTATRDLGASFADSAAVRFDFYELVGNTEWLGPIFRFRHVRTVHAKGRYCDVDDAFARELGLGPAGILRWDGPR